MSNLLSKFQAYIKEREAKQEFEPNSEQQAALDLAFTNEDFCLIGAAGTGKTTTFKFLLAESKKSFEELGIYFVAPTNKAAGNLRRQLPIEHQHRVKTIHKFLEYSPVFYEKLGENGEIIKTRIFEPKRTANNPINGAKIVVIEETSMVSISPLFENLRAACPYAKFIFMGDLNQLSTIYGDSILVDKLSKTPVIELTKVYRQALESPIINLAHAIIKGEPLSRQKLKEEYEKSTPQGKVNFGFFSKKISSDRAITEIGNYFRKLILEGKFQQERDLILIPFNKEFGSIELGKMVAQAFTDLHKQEVWEVIAGFQKLYLAVGDLILYNKENYRITGIRSNPSYFGIQPLTPSIHLNRWGHYTNSSTQNMEDYQDLDLPTWSEEIEEKKNQASHILTLQNTFKDAEEIEIQSVGDLMGIISADVITVHKAQGSEAENVYFILHNSHFRGSVVSRELLYTGVTRARNSLTVICEPDAFEIGIERQRIKGNTLQEKIKNYLEKQ